jgi:hypothetical protein
MPVQERRRVKGALGALQDVVGGRRLPAAPRVQHRRQRVGLVGAPALPLRRPLGSASCSLVRVPIIAHED